MSQNKFGTLFSITSWGESHGKAVGVVIDGCPAGLPLSVEPINAALAKRAPGKTPFTSPRKETDEADILSGTFEGVTTGAPISIIIHNTDADSTQYDSIKNVMRPGHANFTYLHKYGVFDYRGGGRASARETACRVAAGAVAQSFLDTFGIQVITHLGQVGEIKANVPEDPQEILRNLEKSQIFCADPIAEKEMTEAILSCKDRGDSIGGVVHFILLGAPIGLGEPVYEKLHAKLAFGLLNIPATKGFEIGKGFEASSMFASAHNDTFVKENEKIHPKTNNAGGLLGGISTGEPIYGRLAFKPTSSVMLSATTVDLQGNTAEFKLPETARHDPCVAIRAVPVVAAMCRLVLADALLLNQARQFPFQKKPIK